MCVCGAEEEEESVGGSGRSADSQRHTRRPTNRTHHEAGDGEGQGVVLLLRLHVPEHFAQPLAVGQEHQPAAGHREEDQHVDPAAAPRVCGVIRGGADERADDKGGKGGQEPDAADEVDVEVEGEQRRRHVRVEDGPAHLDAHEGDGGPELLRQAELLGAPAVVAGVVVYGLVGARRRERGPQGGRGGDAHGGGGEKRVAFRALAAGAAADHGRGNHTAARNPMRGCDAVRRLRASSGACVRFGD